MLRLLLISYLLSQCSLLAFPQGKSIIVEVRKHIELISALNNQISTSFLKDSVTDPYLYKTTKLMRLNYEHFKKFSKHPAVLATQQMSDKIGTGVYLLGLYYEDFPQAKQKSPISQLILQEIHPDTDSAIFLVKKYMEEVAQFYHDTQFETYFIQNQPLYQLAVEEVKRNIPPDTFIPTLEKYYGTSKDGYHIVVMPSFKSGWGLSWQVEDRGQTIIFNIAAPLQEQILSSTKKVVEAGFDNADEIRNLSVHEFGHSFVNPLTMQASYAAQINRYKHLFKPVPNQGQYSDWLTLFNEHLVRAGEIHIALLMGQVKESKRLQESYKDWMYLPHFIEQLKLYEANRSTYKKLEDYLPVLIASLVKLK